MALWDTADLLQRCIDMAARPANDQEMSDARWYRRLTEAQSYWYGVFATHVPQVLYGAPVLLTTADNGATYTFPAGIFPLGRVVLRSSRSGEVLSSGPEWAEDADYVIEGSRIRMPGGRTRTFSDGPYAQFVTPPTVIDGSTAPTLNPDFARILIVYHACRLWASQGGLRDPNYYWALEQKAAWGDPMSPGDVGIIGALKTQFFASGISGSGVSQSFNWPFGVL